jgi:hypothetical protein
MTFDKWLELTKTDDAAAAELFGRDRAHISKIRRRKVMPSFDLMLVIRDKTEGAVPLDSWTPLEAPLASDHRREPVAN